VLISNAVYGPTRNFCVKTLSRFGVTATFFDPLMGNEVEPLFQPNTRALFLESPASMTFEVQDVPRLAQLARARGCKVLIDNTWATPVFFSPFRYGVDISIHSASKYLVGHSDAIMGVAIAADNTIYQQLRSAWAEMGQTASSDDCFLALRGLRTLHVRLKRHYQSALQIAEWLRERPEVARVLYPALSQSPGFGIWRRDFTGASGLLGIQLKNFSAAAVARMANGMKLFGIGASWGGHESLVLPVNPAHLPATQSDGPLLRLHIGLEDPNDLLRDLEASFARLTL
jgi:cystathionine beta-lyase